MGSSPLQANWPTVVIVAIIAAVVLVVLRSRGRIATKWGSVDLSPVVAELQASATEVSNHASAAREAAVVSARATDEVRQAIGQPNGNGDLVQMIGVLERKVDALGEGQVGLAGQVHHLETTGYQLREGLALLGGRLSEHGTRLDRLLPPSDDTDGET